MLVNTDEMRAPGTAHNDVENKNEHFKFTASREHLTRAKASRFTEVFYWWETGSRHLSVSVLNLTS